MKTKLPELRGEIETVFGKKIHSYLECKELHDAIQEKTGFNISVNTLRRFFGIVNAVSSPSTFTLNILSSYCGYKSFADFSLNYKPVEIKSNSFASDFLAYLISQFENIPVNHENDVTYLNMVRNTILSLKRYPDLFRLLQAQIAKTPNGQNYYFEKFVNIDELNGYYGDGLRFYLAEKKTVEAQLFGHSLLALKHWLSLENQSFYDEYEQVMQFVPDTSIHPSVTGRYFTTQLLHAYLQKTDRSQILQEAKNFYSIIAPVQYKHQGFPCFELTYTAGLILIGEWGEALYYLRENNFIRTFRMASKKTTGLKDADETLFDSLFVYEALALAQLGRIKEAKELYNQIKPTEFYFLTKKVDFILQIKLGAILGKIRNSEKQLSSLIEETGFKRFNDIFQIGNTNLPHLFSAQSLLEVSNSK